MNWIMDETPSTQLPVPTGISTSSSRSSKDVRNGLSLVSTGFSVGSPHDASTQVLDTFAARYAQLYGSNWEAVKHTSPFTSPTTEVHFIVNREKFDYVVLYDWNPMSFGPLNSPLSVLVQTIYEREFTRMLMHAPIILVGG
ncbi:hypothetical protein IW262DRAFT_252206 [Armillaria fumosa]|nr:hypothetical protein IW262DRAFT_252206 [Armillaria fumosa]